MSIRYVAIDKETGDETELKATVYSQAVIELLDILEIKLVRQTVQMKRIQIEHVQKCWVCEQEFNTSDGRIHNCPACRQKLREKPESQRECAHCTREFTTTDKRVKYCPWCIIRDFFCKDRDNEKIACRVCDRDICLEQTKPGSCAELHRKNT